MVPRSYGGIGQQPSAGIVSLIIPELSWQSVEPQWFTLRIWRISRDTFGRSYSLFFTRTITRENENKLFFVIFCFFHFLFKLKKKEKQKLNVQSRTRTHAQYASRQSCLLLIALALSSEPQLLTDAFWPLESSSSPFHQLYHFVFLFFLVFSACPPYNV